MSFNSIRFLVFFCIVALVHQIAPPRWRWVVLLVASYVFYASFDPIYCLLLLTVSLATYAGAILAARPGSQASRRAWLAVCLFIGLGLLGLFKYYNFLAGSINGIWAALAQKPARAVPMLDLVLPVGISFYTFQSLSYVIDVYRGQREPERHAGRYLSYAGFFPVLLSGPITRAGVLLPQLASPEPWSHERAAEGLRQILLGLFKKVVIADRLAVVVAVVFGEPMEYEGLLLLIPAACFSLQIYYDFSGYTDMAMGMAKVLGYRLPDNFNRPYAARSFGEFWHRWHISLSTWFRDYLYIPLGGSREGKPRWYANLMATFLVSGLWHGADWTFVAWGGIHGALLVTEVATRRLRERLLGWLARGWPRCHGFMCLTVTFSCVTLAWVFFRARNLGDAIFILSNMFVEWEFFTFDDLLRLGVGKHEWLATLLCMALYEALSYAEAHGKAWALARLPMAARWAAYYLVLACIVFLGVTDRSDFIYMRF